MDRLSDFIETLCQDGKDSTNARLKRAGFTDKEIGALASRPEAPREVWAAASRRFLIPVIPALLRSIADKAEKGDGDAQKLVVALLGERSPLKDELGLDIGSADDKALGRLASQLKDQLSKLATSLGKEVRA